MTYAKLYLNKPELITKRRSLRQEATKAEQVLWENLKNKQLGYRFRRQFSIGPYILDFYCHGKRLAVEVDGPIHDKNKTRDILRDTWLKTQGIQIIRFKNDEVLFDRDRVMKTILRALQTNYPTLPSPNRGGEC
ncbi:MAG: DUF559 domain-containing protein [Patescibacteria group bacterium]